MPEAVVALGEGKRVVGRLRFESDGRPSSTLASSKRPIFAPWMQ